MKQYNERTITVTTITTTNAPSNTNTVTTSTNTDVNANVLAANADTYHNTNGRLTHSQHKPPSTIAAYIERFRNAPPTILQERKKPGIAGGQPFWWQTGGGGVGVASTSSVALSSAASTTSVAVDSEACEQQKHVDTKNMNAVSQQHQLPVSEMEVDTCSNHRRLSVFPTLLRSMNDEQRRIDQLLGKKDYCSSATANKQSDVSFTQQNLDLSPILSDNRESNSEMQPSGSTRLEKKMKKKTRDKEKELRNNRKRKEKSERARNNKGVDMDSNSTQSHEQNILRLMRKFDIDPSFFTDYSGAATSRPPAISMDRMPNDSISIIHHNPSLTNPMSAPFLTYPSPSIFSSERIAEEDVDVDALLAAWRASLLPKKSMVTTENELVMANDQFPVENSLKLEEMNVPSNLTVKSDVTQSLSDPTNISVEQNTYDAQQSIEDEVKSASITATTLASVRDVGVNTVDFIDAACQVEIENISTANDDDTKDDVSSSSHHQLQSLIECVLTDALTSHFEVFTDEVNKVLHSTSSSSEVPISMQPQESVLLMQRPSPVDETIYPLTDTSQMESPKILGRNDPDPSSDLEVKKDAYNGCVDENPVRSNIPLPQLVDRDNFESVGSVELERKVESDTQISSPLPQEESVTVDDNVISVPSRIETPPLSSNEPTFLRNEAEPSEPTDPYMAVNPFPDEQHHEAFHASLSIHEEEVEDVPKVAEIEEKCSESTSTLASIKTESINDSSRVSDAQAEPAKVTKNILTTNQAADELANFLVFLGIVNDNDPDWNAIRDDESLLPIVVRCRLILKRKSSALRKRC